MSVFKIQQPGIKTQAREETNSNPVTDTNPQNLQDEELSDELSGKSSRTTDTIVGRDDSVINGMAKLGSDEPQVQVDPDNALPAGAKDVLIKIDGPVGRVFTDALNRVLANESYMTMLPVEAEGEGEAAPTQGGSHPHGIVQVYCWTADELLLDDVVAITNDVSKHTERDYVIAVETAGKVTREMALLEPLAKMKNVKVCFSQEAALSLVRSKLA